MLFNSYVFIFAFLPCVWIVHRILMRTAGRRAAIGALVLASLFFYGWWNARYVALILASIAVNFVAGRHQANSRHASGRGDRTALVAALVFNLGLIGYYKYSNFFVDSVNAAFGTTWHLETIILPLAISFFTFQQIAYAVDAYRGRCEEYDLLDYCLFVTFFPQLIAGPIVHHQEVLPQFKRSGLRFRWEDLAIGGTFFVIGLFKKVVFADNVAPLATGVFDAVHAGAAPDLVAAWGAAVAYSLQLYFDFSGYSDMAIGLARMFGIVLPVNFDSPYKARSIADFWGRWHLTLSRFLRDYLYIPLGGNRRGSFRRYRNLMITMLLGGLWHGAGWTFVVWGGLHGLYLMINHGWRALTAGHAWADSPALRPVYHAVTLLAVMVGWVFFRALDFDDGGRIVTGMFGLAGVDVTAWSGVGSSLGSLWLPVGFGPSVAGWSLCSVLAGIALFAPNTQEMMGAFFPERRELARAAWRWNASARWALISGILFVAAVMELSSASEFLYFQF
ncbi:MAG: MBOAT family O-acyltransferase [Myxococcota bacterium]